MTKKAGIEAKGVLMRRVLELQRWLREHGVPKGKLDEEPKGIPLSLYQENKLRIDNWRLRVIVDIKITKP